MADGKIEVARTLDPSFDVYLVDHQIDGRPVMPMAVGLELLAEIAVAGWPDLKLTAVRELRVLRGIMLENGPLTVRVLATPKITGDGATKIELRAETGGDKPHIHYMATAELASVAPTAPSVTRLKLLDAKPLGLTIEEAYEQWLFHGPLFAGIVEVEAVGQNGIIAKLAPSSPQRCLAESASPHWLIDPVVVDSGLQLLILWARTHLDMTPLPARLGCYHYFAPMPQGEIRCEVAVRHSAGNAAIHADLMFFDSAGALVGWMEDMEVTASKALNRLSQTRTGPAGVKS